jgi:hypothetical protein
MIALSGKGACSNLRFAALVKWLDLTLSSPYPWLVHNFPASRPVATAFKVVAIERIAKPSSLALVRLVRYTRRDPTCPNFA